MVMDSNINKHKFSLEELLSDEPMFEQIKLKQSKALSKRTSSSLKKFALRARKTIVKKSKGKRGRAK